MNENHKRFILTLIFGLFGVTMFSQSSREIIVKKPGGLAKQIKKKEITEVTSLKLAGTVSTIDLDFINSLPNLKVLDVRRCKLQDEGIYGVEWSFKSSLDSLIIGSTKFSLSQKRIKYIEAPMGELRFSHNLFIDKLCLDSEGNRANRITEKDFNRTFYGATGKTFSGNYKDKVNIDTLLVSGFDNLYLVDRNYGLCPNVAIEMQGNKKVLYQYTGEDESFIVDDSYLAISDKAFQKKMSLKKIEISSTHITLIEEKAFEDCQKLENVLIKSPILRIEPYAFANCEALSSVTFPSTLEEIGSNAFKGCGLRELILPRSLKKISGYTFSEMPKLTRVEFLSSSEVEVEKGSSKALETALSNVEVKIPKGSYGAYTKYESSVWQNIALLEEGQTRQNHLKITVSKPGSILSYINPRQFNLIDSLTIEGVLYETDMNVINKCKSLKYLDLGRTIIRYSPEKIKEQEEETAALGAVFGMIGAGLDAEYEDFNISTMEHDMSKALTELIEASIKSKKPVKSCIIPSRSLNGMLKLQTLILPTTVSKIYQSINNCYSLTSIIIPDCCRQIVNSFNNCIELKDVTFPKSLTNVTGFSGCHSLTMVDLSNCTFSATEWNKEAFSHCNNLKTIKFPEGIEEIGFTSYPYEEDEKSKPKNFTVSFFFPSSLRTSEIGANNASIHFKTNTPPKGKLFGSSSITIYCPKGSLTSYYSKYGSGFEYKEE